MRRRNPYEIYRSLMPAFSLDYYAQAERALACQDSKAAWKAVTHLVREGLEVPPGLVLLSFGVTVAGEIKGWFGFEDARGRFLRRDAPVADYIEEMESLALSFLRLRSLPVFNAVRWDNSIGDKLRTAIEYVREATTFALTDAVARLSEMAGSALQLGTWHLSAVVRHPQYHIADSMASGYERDKQLARFVLDSGDFGMPILLQAVRELRAAVGWDEEESDYSWGVIGGFDLGNYYYNAVRVLALQPMLSHKRQRRIPVWREVPSEILLEVWRDIYHGMICAKKRVLNRWRTVMLDVPRELWSFRSYHL